MPVPQPGGAALRGAAVLIAEVVIPALVVPDPAEVVARVAWEAAGANTGMITGSEAIRIDHSVADSAAQADAALGSQQRIEYVIAVPNDPRWLSIYLSVQAIDGFDMDQTIAECDKAVAGLTWSAARS